MFLDLNLPLDITFLGVQMPTLLPIFVSLAVFMIWVDTILSELGAYKYVWHAGLFRTALFVCLFSFACLTIYH